MDGVEMVIRLAVEEFISRGSLAWAIFTGKAKKSRSGRSMCLTHYPTDTAHHVCITSNSKLEQVRPDSAF
jgi:hypothetical protein